MSSPTALTARDVWAAITHASFAVISHLTPSGAPRSSGVLYACEGERMYVVVADNSWKARHIAGEGLIAVTVPIRRGGLLSLLAPIPPATVSFPAVASVYHTDLLDGIPRLSRLVPPERRTGCVVLEIRPIGHYVTYGIGVSLRDMRDPRRSRARVPVRSRAHSTDPGG